MEDVNVLSGSLSEPNPEDTRKDHTDEADRSAGQNEQVSHKTKNSSPGYSTDTLKDENEEVTVPENKSDGLRLSKLEKAGASKSDNDNKEQDALPSKADSDQIKTNTILNKKEEFIREASLTKEKIVPTSKAPQTQTVEAKCENQYNIPPRSSEDAKQTSLKSTKEPAQPPENEETTNKNSDDPKLQSPSTLLDFKSTTLEHASTPTQIGQNPPVLKHKDSLENKLPIIKSTDVSAKKSPITKPKFSSSNESSSPKPNDSSVRKHSNPGSFSPSKKPSSPHLSDKPPIPPPVLLRPQLDPTVATTPKRNRKQPTFGRGVPPPPKTKGPKLTLAQLAAKK